MNRIAEFFRVSEKQFDHADYCGIALPKRATAGSAGYDFFAPYDFVLPANGEITVRTGIRAKIAQGWFLMILPRSGAGFKYGVRLANTAGIIDSDYFGADNEGHILIKLIGGNAEYSVKKGTAFAQGIFMQYGITTDDVCEDVRVGGFGSTDKREDIKK